MAIVMPKARAAWESAVAAYHAAEAAVSSHPYSKASPSDENYKELEADQAPYLRNSTATLNALLDTPSPDAAALAEKLAIYAREFGGDNELTTVIADAHRFLLKECKPSLITALQARYDQTLAEYTTVEVAEMKVQQAGTDTERFALERGRKASSRESDALRAAILHQVPTSWADVAVLQYHIVTAFDLFAGLDDNSDDDRDLLQGAIDTVFDFICRNVDITPAELGSEFQNVARLARIQRERRTGVVGE